MSVTCFTVSAVVILVNLLDSASSEFLHPVNVLSLSVVTAGLFVVAVFAFISAYNSSAKAALVDGVVLVVLLCCWCALCVMSLLGTTSVCIRTRCPESLWLAERSWGTGMDTKTVMKEEVTTEQVTTSRTTKPPVMLKPTRVRKRPRLGQRYDGYYYPHYYKGIFLKLPFQTDSRPGRERQKPTQSDARERQKQRDREPLEAYSRQVRYPYLISIKENVDRNHSFYFPMEIKYGIPLVGSVVLFFLNLVLLLYGVIAVCRWRKEIQQRNDRPRKGSPQV